MSEMIKRVARAIAKAESCTDNWPCGMCDEPDGCTSVARVAIKEMREPTDKMMMAGESPDTGPYECQGIYHRMIDAALANGGREDG